MATVVIAVIGKLGAAVAGELGEAAVGQIANQASFLLKFENDFAWLQLKLTHVTGYLQYANNANNDAVKKWLGDVQDIALDIEDIVEECALQPLYNKGHISKRIFQWKIGKRIGEIRNRMKSIMEDATELKLAHEVCHLDQPFTSHGGGEEWKKAGVVERDSRPIAIDAKVEQILHLLKDDALQAVAVVGMGGIGKTFLLQNVYNHHKVPEIFQKAIWLSISQNFSIKSLQFDIASHLDLKDELKDVSEQRATELIQQKLAGKNVLIVLDDVWMSGPVNNLIAKLGIPGGTSNGCKIVVTTRSIDVCNVMGISQIYHMELLSEEDSWNLFCLNAFPDHQPSEELKKVANQVERKCRRLPLAIKTVAASMAGEILLDSWKTKLQQLKKVSDLQEPVMPTLRLSYDALPAVLKPCFLYFSFFGEDVEIDTEYLIYLWIGESFIPEGEEQWATGWRYLKQLNNLCLIEVSEDRELRKTCKIHDLLLDLAIFISRENKCAFTVEEASSSGCRRVLLSNKGLDNAAMVDSRFEGTPSLRTLSLSGNNLEELPTKSLSGVRALRVIDLSYTGIRTLPKCIGNLKLLRVLNLNVRSPYFANIRYIEQIDCIRNLKSLCFLGVNWIDCPEWIGDLKFLQYLHVFWVTDSVYREISKLDSLRTLRIHDIGLNLMALKDAAKLIRLQELVIDISAEEERRSLEEGVLAQLVNMRRLTLRCARNRVRPEIPEKMKAMENLEYLELRHLGIPTWICKYENLRVLKLDLCTWIECPALDTMPNLMSLDIYAPEECNGFPESFGRSRGFPQLRYFVINLGGLGKLPNLQHQAMPLLEEFKAHRSFSEWDAKRIPEGFEHLSSLKLLSLRAEWRAERINERKLLEEGGEYWNKIKANNPQVTIRV